MRTSHRDLIVLHDPVGQPRHKISTRGGFASMYLPSRHPVHSFKRSIRESFGKKDCHLHPVSITVFAYFARPKSKVWKTKPMPMERHLKKPDADNVLKAVLDALNGVAWYDDAQVFSATVEKYICDGDSQPRCEIQINIYKDATV